MPVPSITLVVAHTENRVIGRGGGMPWHLPADLAHFKAVTMGKPMLMGRRTFESIGRALPGRRSIVVTRNPTWSAPGVEVAHSVDEALDLCASAPEVAVIGGGELFNALLPRATRILQTIIHTELDGDTHFPAVEPRDWHETRRETRPPDEYNAYGLSFVELERKT
ncbi:MAG: dihydrofolate reductase [Gammaproteobacteria bacterium]